MPFNCQSCLRFLPERQRAPTPPPPPIPPRCLLLGPSGSGKTTFLRRIRGGECCQDPVEPTTGCNGTRPSHSTYCLWIDKKTNHGLPSPPPPPATVEEVLISPGCSLIFSDIGACNRREVRLHFLHAVPILDLSILFFIDVSASFSELPCTIVDLDYCVSYARSRAGYGTKYVGIVLNKQDLLLDDEVSRSGRVARITREVNVVMSGVAVGNPEVGELKWEVLDGGTGGISASTGQGVDGVLMAVARAVFGGDIPCDASSTAPAAGGLRDMATGMAGVAGELLGAVKGKAKLGPAGELLGAKLGLGKEAAKSQERVGVAGSRV